LTTAVRSRTAGEIALRTVTAPTRKTTRATQKGVRILLLLVGEVSGRRPTAERFSPERDMKEQAFRRCYGPG